MTRPSLAQAAALLAALARLAHASAAVLEPLGRALDAAAAALAAWDDRRSRRYPDPPSDPPSGSDPPPPASARAL